MSKYKSWPFPSTSIVNWISCRMLLKTENSSSEHIIRIPSTYFLSCMRSYSSSSMDNFNNIFQLNIFVITDADSNYSHEQVLWNECSVFNFIPTLQDENTGIFPITPNKAMIFLNRIFVVSQFWTASVFKQNYNWLSMKQTAITIVFVYWCKFCCLFAYVNCLCHLRASIVRWINSRDNIVRNRKKCNK